MQYHYAHKYLVGYSDVDSNNKMRLSRIVDMLQNVATWHSNSIGYGTSKMMELKWGWLVLAWKIKVLEYPVADEEIEIRTWSKPQRGLHAYRAFEIVDNNNKTLVLAESSWILYDLENKKPLRLPTEMMEKYGAIDRNALEDGISKFKDEKIEGEKLEITVMKRDIDTNHHVNNAKYIEFFEEILPNDVLLKEIEIHYKHQTLLGEKLLLTLNENTCTMQNQNGDINTVILYKN